MSDKGKKKIGVISMARNDDFFIPKWVDYYGEQFGKENLFLVLDGFDQKIPEQANDINVIKVPHISLGRAEGDRNRARLVSSFAKSLFYRYDRVIAHDIDEFLVLDPQTGMNLDAYLQKNFSTKSLSGLGLDVGQHLDVEQKLDPSRPFLEQRSFAHVSARYTKPVVANSPLTWGSGFHRVKGKNFHIDPNLFLFHFGMVDFKRAKGKTNDVSRIDAGWGKHLDRRYQLFELITKGQAIDGDSFFTLARRRQSGFRPIFAWNKPGTLKEKPVIKIPERFRSVI